MLPMYRMRCLRGWLPNGAAMLFTGAKVSQLAVLPQGKVEAKARVTNMVQAMKDCGFGNCTNHYECMAACPKGITSSLSPG